MLGSRSKLKNVGIVYPLKLYDSDVTLVKQYSFLGVILDSEMTLRPFYDHVRKNVYVKIFALAKMRDCLTEYAAIMIYKQTILPVVVLRTDVIYKNIKMMHYD